MDQVTSAIYIFQSVFSLKMSKYQVNVNLSGLCKTIRSLWYLLFKNSLSITEKSKYHTDVILWLFWGGKPTLKNLLKWSFTSEILSHLRYYQVCVIVSHWRDLALNVLPPALESALSTGTNAPSHPHLICWQNTWHLTFIFLKTISINNDKDLLRNIIPYDLQNFWHNTWTLP